MTTATNLPEMPPVPVWRRFWPLVLLLVAVAFAYAMGWHRVLSLTYLYEQRSALKGLIENNFVLSLIVYAVVYMAVTALSLPGGLILTIAGGFLFGWLFGSIGTVIGATAGATLLFLVVRTSFGESLSCRAGPFVEKLAAGFRTDAFSYLLFLRLVPAFPFFVVNLVPALCGVSLRTYVLATFIGIIPGTVAFAFAGSGLDSVFAAQGASYEACKASGAAACELAINVKALVTPELFIAFLALGVVSLLPIALKRFGRKS